MTVHTLTDVQLLGPKPGLSEGASARFTVILRPEHAEQVNALAPYSPVKPGRDGRLWLSAPTRSPLPVRRDPSYPWGDAFPNGTRGDVLFRMTLVETERFRGNVVGFLAVRITGWPTWEEFALNCEAIT